MAERRIAQAGLEGWMTLPRASIAALLVLAPLMCIVFCHVVDAIHRPVPTADWECAPAASQQPAAAREDNHAPLAGLQQLIRAVTECAPSPAGWLAALSVVASLMPIQDARPSCIARQPPKPPPRPII